MVVSQHSCLNTWGLLKCLFLFTSDPLFHMMGCILGWRMDIVEWAWIWQRAYNCHEKPSLPHLLPNKWPPDSTCPRSLPYSKSNSCQSWPAINPCSAMTFFSSKKGGDSLTALQNRGQVYSSVQIERSSKVLPQPKVDFPSVARFSLMILTAIWPVVSQRFASPRHPSIEAL